MIFYKDIIAGESMKDKLDRQEGERLQYKKVRTNLTVGLNKQSPEGI